MKPINADNAPCSPQSSNCVIWAGPDISCINLCTGDTISDTVSKLATELCTIMTTLKVSSYDLSCFSLATCPPAKFEELIQLLIERICALESVSTTDSTTSTGDCPTGCIMTIESCLITGEETTMNLTDYVTLIAKKVCSLVSDISLLQNQINSLDIRVDALENAPAPSFTMPKFTVGCDLSSTVALGTSHTLTDILTALVNDSTYGYCSFRTLTGGNTTITDAISRKCILDANIALSSASGQDMITKYAGSWITDASNITMASAINNIWIALCDTYAFLATYEIKVTDTNTIDLTATLDAANGDMGVTLSAKLVDTGWKDLSGFGHQGGTVGAPQARRIGNVVHFRGDVFIPLSDGAGGVQAMTNVDTYRTVARNNTALGVTGGAVAVDNVVYFNENDPVVPTSIMDTGTTFQNIVGLGGGNIIATRQVAVDTGTVLMTAFMEVYMSTDKRLYYKALNVLESNIADTASYDGASAANFITTNAQNGKTIPNYNQVPIGNLHSNAIGTQPSYQTSGTLVAGQLYTIVNFEPGDVFTNVGAADNATGQTFIASGTTPTTWSNGSAVATGIGLGFGTQSDGSGGYADYPFALDASKPDEVGGFKFCLDGLTCFIDPCTTDIQPSKVCP
tara:strand:- start:23838 stop:25715 length:1878 start_codon:yes stop_codon:yes gene_type:complete